MGAAAPTKLNIAPPPIVTPICVTKDEKVLLALLVKTFFLCSIGYVYYRLVYLNSFTCLKENLSSVTEIFAVTLSFALITLHIIVDDLKMHFKSLGTRMTLYDKFDDCPLILLYFFYTYA